MKVQYSNQISSFGGINFVLNEFNNKEIDKLINKNLPQLPNQSKFKWKDIFYSFWSILFCGGENAEDISINLKSSLSNNPFFNIPSPDRILNRMKQLSEPVQICLTPRGKKEHQFSMNTRLNKLNMMLLKKTSNLQKGEHTLDYDNTIIYSNKADAKMTYKKQLGYTPGVGIIGKDIVYVENRNGNSTAETLQDETMKRMFKLLSENNIKIKNFRADSASYRLSTLLEVEKNVDKIFVKARMSASLNEAINKVKKWKKVKIDDEIAYRGSVDFNPFKKVAKKENREALKRKYKLVITKIKRRDGQYNLFTSEPYNYSAILTNDFEKTNDEVVFFYNNRGAIEKEFDVLKNDFAWQKMPFSKIEYNTVFLLITAMCKNLYNYIITEFSEKYKYLSANFRIKKFIFRFICIPAKWIKTARMYKLKIYGNINLKT